MQVPPVRLQTMDSSCLLILQLFFYFAISIISQPLKFPFHCLEGVFKGYNIHPPYGFAPSAYHNETMFASVALVHAWIANKHID